MQGMQALIGSLGLIETEWRRTGLPDMSIEQIAAAANQFSSQLRQS